MEFVWSVNVLGERVRIHMADGRRMSGTLVSWSSEQVSVSVPEYAMGSVMQSLDYVWLATLTIGLVSATGQARRILAPTEISIWTTRANTALDIARRSIQPSYYCRSYTRTCNSPPNFDEIVRASDSICLFARSIVSALPDTVTPALTSDDILLREPPNLPDGLAAVDRAPEIWIGSDIFA